MNKIEQLDEAYGYALQACYDVERAAERHPYDETIQQLRKRAGGLLERIVAARRLEISVTPEEIEYAEGYADLVIRAHP